MAIVIDTETNVVLTAGVSSQVAPVNNSRKNVSIQVQAPGPVWLKLTGPASPGDGFFSKGFRVIVIDSSFAQQQPPDFYEGPVNVMWMGGGADEEGNPLKTCNCRVIEAS